MKPAVASWRDTTSHLPTSGHQIYIHVPFCPFFCHFCPLYKTKDARDRTAARREQFVGALIREIQMYGRLKAGARDVEFRTVYFGGGTPTELEPEQLGRILNAVRDHFRLAGDVEVTLEGVATQMLRPGYLDACLSYGFNRVSFGVQTLDLQVRKRIGRGESCSDYPRLVESVRVHHPGLPLNLDLMIGLPGQEVESFESDLDKVLDWHPDSVDVYSCWMVPGTRLFEMAAQGRWTMPRYGSKLLAMRRTARRRLQAAGYRAVTGEAHVRSDRNAFIRTTFGGGGNALNCAMGFGPSAIGFINGTMYRNVCNLSRYLETIDRGYLPIDRAQALDVRAAQRRAVLLGVQRLSLHTALLQARTERRLFERWGAQGLVTLDGEVYSLTDEGSLWYNQMQLALLPKADALRLVGLLGAAEEQSRAMSPSARGTGALPPEAVDLIRGSRSLWGTLRLLGYRAYMGLRRLAVFDGRALSFAGPVDRLSPATLPLSPATLLTTREKQYGEACRNHGERSTDHGP